MGAIIAVGVVGALILLGSWVVATYNRLVRLRNRREEAWSGIDVQLTRRFDLVPNLVEVVKQYAAHEADTLENVTKARAAMQAADGPAAKGAADEQLNGALRQLFAVAEDYPDLKAAAGFLQLQGDLTAIEEDISFARRYYNAVVEDLNTLIQSFPSLLVARPLGFRRAEFFKADVAAGVAPEVAFES